MPEPYKKPFLTVPEQILHLRKRGMVVSDPESASSLLRNVGYYRLSGYSYLFRQRDLSQGAAPDARLSSFIGGTTIELVNDVYQFDRGLRRLVFDAIERVEIALRFSIGHILGQSHAFAHRDPSALHSRFTGLEGAQDNLRYSGWLDSKHAEWLRDLDREEKRSQEAFVLHFDKKYGKPLPVWVVTEILSFGTLGRLYGGLNQAHRERIAEDLLVLNAVPNGDSATLANWLNHLRYVRNTCAHHARLWNRNISIKLNSPTGIPDLHHLAPLERRNKIYGTLAVLGFLLERLDPGNGWRTQLTDYITKGLTRIKQSPASMGFPDDWEDLDIWNEDYKPVGDLTLQHKMIQDGFESQPTGETSLLLRPNEPDRKKRAAWVRWLRSQHLLLGLKLSSTIEYPSFQLDNKTQAVIPIVAEANRQVFKFLASSTDSDQEGWLDQTSWEVARWWMTAAPEGGDRTPLQLQEDGALTENLLGQIIARLSDQ